MAKRAGHKNKFDVIFMDLQMPIMDGYGATVELRKLMKKGTIPETPIIAISANDRKEDKMRCKSVGMVDHMSKPITEEKLKEIISKHLKY
mmetsp:Transcript_35724/g.32190  ORF Transcript_35724/g.32190 Transcript_35724/m.32190 type:complete len:90 (+) Transcript_35724:345-614(+)